MHAQVYCNRWNRTYTREKLKIRCDGSTKAQVMHKVLVAEKVVRNGDGIQSSVRHPETQQISLDFFRVKRPAVNLSMSPDEDSPLGGSARANSPSSSYTGCSMPPGLQQNSPPL